MNPMIALPMTSAGPVAHEASSIEDRADLSPALTSDVAEVGKPFKERCLVNSRRLVGGWTKNPTHDDVPAR